MNRFLSIATLSLLPFLIVACSPAPERSTSAGHIVRNGKAADFSDTKAVKAALYSEYQHWKGTRYALGGMNRRGIDCSGLTYMVYKKQFGIELPRTTLYQSKAGQWIKRSELRPGDLVFFKTESKARHVGIYVEGNQFLHASTSKGVMLSTLDNPYWKEKYWHSRRVSF
ncbi:NlpC/P60 family protein [Oceanospirillum sediminis]|uniref:C40 family peptidase n=1 Tax=Oceanospirillum sediminis TaxID=2760088 RepID=A0A839IME9_9GAMM|nr:NlpC/P60 family protein [Oceanospirillum sediminis]MBB1486071.1 C40 family peptidase [Oceanospirillum sediminis]